MESSGGESNLEGLMGLIGGLDFDDDDDDDGAFHGNLWCIAAVSGSNS